MKSMIIYSSHYGNTASVVRHFLEVLEKKGEVDVFELVKSSELACQFPEDKKALVSQRVDLEHSPVDLKDYRIICLGIPLWNKLPEPPLSSYLMKCNHLDDKDIICCIVHGNPENAKSCSLYLKEILAKKSKPRIIVTSIHWKDVENQQILSGLVRQAISKINYL